MFETSAIYSKPFVYHPDLMVTLVISKMCLFYLKKLSVVSLHVSHVASHIVYVLNIDLFTLENYIVLVTLVICCL